MLASRKIYLFYTVGRAGSIITKHDNQTFLFSNSQHLESKPCQSFILLTQSLYTFELTLSQAENFIN